MLDQWSFGMFEHMLQCVLILLSCLTLVILALVSADHCIQGWRR